jgi:hypothetical protein
MWEVESTPRRIVEFSFLSLPVLRVDAAQRQVWPCLASRRGPRGARLSDGKAVGPGRGHPGASGKADSGKGGSKAASGRGRGRGASSSGAPPVIEDLGEGKPDVLSGDEGVEECEGDGCGGSDISMDGLEALFGELCSDGEEGETLGCTVGDGSVGPVGACASASCPADVELTPGPMPPASVSGETHSAGASSSSATLPIPELPSDLAIDRRAFFSKEPPKHRLDVGGGVIRWHQSKASFEATCNNEFHNIGGVRCVLTRQCTADKRRSKGCAVPIGGRPLASMYAFLENNNQGSKDERFAYAASIDYETRLAYRYQLESMPEARPLLSEERLPEIEAGEDIEPHIL